MNVYILIDDGHFVLHVAKDVSIVLEPQVFFTYIPNQLFAWVGRYNYFVLNDAQQFHNAMETLPSTEHGRDKVSFYVGIVFVVREHQRILFQGRGTNDETRSNLEGEIEVEHEQGIDCLEVRSQVTQPRHEVVGSGGKQGIVLHHAFVEELDEFLRHEHTIVWGTDTTGTGLGKTSFDGGIGQRRRSGFHVNGNGVSTMFVGDHSQPVVVDGDF